MKNKLSYYIKQNVFLIMVLIIPFLVYNKWLPFSIFAYSDFLFSFKESLKDLLIPSIWTNSFFNFGSVNLFFWRLPIMLLNGMIGFLGFNSNIADKFLVILPVLIFPGLFSFLLLKRFFDSKLPAFVGSLVFSYNTYFLAISTQGHLLIILASSFALLSLLLFMKLLEKREIFLSVLLALSLFILGSMDLRILYITIWVLFLYFLYFVFIINSIDIKKILNISTHVLFSLGLFFLLNFYWIISLFQTKSLLSNVVLQRGLFGNSFWSLPQALTLFHPFWNGSKPEWFIVQSIPIYFWLIPILAFVSLLFITKEKSMLSKSDILFFSLIALIGIFLTKQVSPPFGSIYEWLFNNFPGFNAFREASKFYFLINFGYAGLIAYSSYKIYLYLRKNSY